VYTELKDNCDLTQKDTPPHPALLNKVSSIISLEIFQTGITVSTYRI